MGLIVIEFHFLKKNIKVCKQLIMMIEDAIHSSIEEFIERN